MISCKSVSICNRCHGRLVDFSRNCGFWRGYPNLMHLSGELLEHRTSKLALLKSTFIGENFIRWLSCPIASDFGAVYSWNMCRSLKSRKIDWKPLFLDFNVVQGYRCWYPRRARLVSSACYDMQKVCVYLQRFSSYISRQYSRNRGFWRGYPHLMHL